MAGECSAYYAVYGGRITKTKQNCQNVEIAGEYENVNKVNNLAVNIDMYTVTIETSEDMSSFA